MNSCIEVLQCTQQATSLETEQHGAVRESDLSCGVSSVIGCPRCSGERADKAPALSSGGKSARAWYCSWGELAVSSLFQLPSSAVSSGARAASRLLCCSAIDRQCSGGSEQDCPRTSCTRAQRALQATGDRAAGYSSERNNIRI